MTAYITEITSALFNEILGNGLFEIFALTFILSIGFSIFIGIRHSI